MYVSHPYDLLLLFILFLRVFIYSHLYNYCLKARQQVWDMSLSCFLIIVLINDAILYL